MANWLSTTTINVYALLQPLHNRATDIGPDPRDLWLIWKIVEPHHLDYRAIGGLNPDLQLRVAQREVGSIGQDQADANKASHRGPVLRSIPVEVVIVVSDLIERDRI